MNRCGQIFGMIFKFLEEQRFENAGTIFEIRLK